MFLSLAFVPIEFLKFEYNNLKNYILINDNANPIVPFFNEFQNSFGKNIDNFNKNKSSIFSVDFWSVSNRILNDVKKNNNVIEGWNGYLSNNITSKNPNLFEIGTEIKRQHASVEYKISKILI
ncbi:hypothetical protein DMUE_3556 [Dictyocoela muelleri]|nr:hypothetical protein DMUE_3556 [Dictyocoela muelleri]